MSHWTPETIRTEAARLRPVLDDALNGVTTLHKNVDQEVGELPEEMLDWLVEPSLTFYLLGHLASVVEALREGCEHLDEVVEATPESVRRKWLELRAARRS